jgi:hypothetical protein
MEPMLAMNGADLLRWMREGCGRGRLCIRRHNLLLLDWLGL